MEVTLQLWSKDYSPVECNDPFTAQVSYDLWQRIMREDEGKATFFVFMTGLFHADSL